MIRTITPALFMLAAPAWADVPQVITDFAPIHSLTAQVMLGVGAPANLLPAGAEPHDYDMSPGDAANLAGADIVIWTGASLMPWLADPIATLAPNAQQLVLLETDGWESLPTREQAKHDDHDGHEDHADHDDHDDHADEHAGHDHGPVDPHAWVDPTIAAVWVGHIAEALALADPENAATYRANAIMSQADLQALATEISATLDGVSGAYVLPHDGYQYFEHRFDIPAAASIAATDANEPGPARIAALRDMMQSRDITCVLTDRETDPAWATLLTDGTTARTAQIDATGADFPLGPDAYSQMMRQLAANLSDCMQ